MQESVTSGNRRFTCLASGLVRMEFSLTGTFENRRSMVAYAQQQPVKFKHVEERDGVLRLQTDKLTLISRDSGKDFFPSNLEVRWMQGGVPQCWNPGSRDHQNLGGTIRSYDCFDQYARLAGVHTADMTSPDEKALIAPISLLGEADPVYYKEAGAMEQLDALNRAGGPHRAVAFAPDTMMVRTLNAVLDQYRYGVGVLSKSGYFLLNDSVSTVMDAQDFPVERNTPGTRDWYLFVYGDDYATALHDFMALTGRAPLPPKQVFGLFLSRYPAYDAKEAKMLVKHFDDKGIPLSVLVVDMEWHKPGWCNWEWNSDFYPRPKAFFDWCHAHGLLVTLNVHPQHVRLDDAHCEPYRQAAGAAARTETVVENGREVPVVRVDICDRTQATAFMRVCHDQKVREGMDFWWLDGDHGTMNGTHPQLVANKVYFENAQRTGQRGMLLSRYGGAGSHRYGVAFTGDSSSQWHTLQSQCEFNIRAGHIGMGYVSHDIGGFIHPSTPLIDPILYIRWLQFGIFNPVFRFHSAPGSGSRLPWDYGEANASIARRWLSFRNSLVPYIYGAARRHHDEGFPIVRGLFLDHPHDAAAYRFDQFMFGDVLLVAPVLSARDDRTVYLPAGGWYNYMTGHELAGGCELPVMYGLDGVPLFVKAGGILLRQRASQHPAACHVRDLHLEVFPSVQGSALLYEDDGRSRGYETGECAETTYSVQRNARTVTIAASPTSGAPQGSRRRITLEVVLERMPSRVEFNGRPLRVTANDFNGSSRRLNIVLPETTVSKAWKVVIRR